MLTKIIAIVLLCSMTKKQYQVHGDCLLEKKNLTDVLHIKETALKGDALVNIGSEGTETWTFFVTMVNAEEKWAERINTYFTMDMKNNTYTLTLAKQLDLEAVNIVMGLLYNITIQFSCTSLLHENVWIHNMDIIVIPVDEFPPIFIGSPFAVTLTEETEVGSVVLDLGSKIEDDDVLSDEQRVFQVVPYMIHQFDGSSTFAIPNNDTGCVTLEKSLDYEAMTQQFGRPFFMINVTVQDGGSMKSYTRVNFTVIDVDDQGPEFLYEGCQRPCLNLAISLHISRNYTGSLLDHDLLARDRDTQNHVIEYYLIAGNKSEDVEYEDYFSVDRMTGHVTETRPLNNLSISYINLTIKAQEVSEKGYYIYANINILVEDRKYSKSCKYLKKKKGRNR